jgi:hypothetical protein
MCRPSAPFSRTRRGRWDPELMRVVTCFHPQDKHPVGLVTYRRRDLRKPNRFHGNILESHPIKITPIILYSTLSLRIQIVW